MPEQSDYLARNREAWTKSNADHTDQAAEKAWASEEITWGMFSVPESEVRALPDLGGRDVVELGCGTAYFGAWLAKRGARVVGIDLTPAQLDTARRIVTADWARRWPAEEIWRARKRV